MALREGWWWWEGGVGGWGSVVLEATSTTHAHSTVHRGGGPRRGGQRHVCGVAEVVELPHWRWQVHSSLGVGMVQGDKGGLRGGRG